MPGVSIEASVEYDAKRKVKSFDIAFNSESDEKISFTKN
jgi:hypothetical protein